MIRIGNRIADWESVFDIVDWDWGLDSRLSLGLGFEGLRIGIGLLVLEILI